MTHPFEHCLRELPLESSSNNTNERFHYFDITQVNTNNNIVHQLPLSIKILLEMIIRKCDGTPSGATKQDVDNILNWQTKQGKVEVPFWPARVVLQDFTGVPVVADLAAMRDCVAELAAREISSSSPKETSEQQAEAETEANRIAAELVNPLVDVDLVIDHSIQAVEHGNRGALRVNESVEMRQNAERFQILQWASKSFRNFRIVPPGSGIVHQVNLEVLSRVVFSRPMNFSISKNNNNNSNNNNILYPDTLVGTDSHTTMVNGIGVMGWGVGGIEAEAAMLGEPSQMLLPAVIGVRITGDLPSVCTATDVVLLIVQMLRKENVVGKFVEFFGDGIKNHLTAADRSTISNMCPEYGATCALFNVDDVTMQYLSQTGRSTSDLNRIEQYFKHTFASPLVHDPEKVVYSRTLHVDLGTVTPSLAGPKRPQDRIPLSTLREDFLSCLSCPIPGHKSFAGGFSKSKKMIKQKSSASASSTSDEYDANQSFPPLEIPSSSSFDIKHGAVVLAAITSCTNTSNPDVMVAAGLLARNARRLGLNVKPFVKTSLSPGSRVVTEYLTNSGLLKDLESLGFFIAGYGCMTCIGNSGPLVPGVSEFIRKNNLVASAVLSGNRNFEGRVHPDILANYLASPPLVVALALAGTVNIDFEKDPIGYSNNNGNGNNDEKNDRKPIFLKDVWPDKNEIKQLVAQYVSREAFESIYDGGNPNAMIWKGNESWQELSRNNSSINMNISSSSNNASSVVVAPRFKWNPSSTYIQPPPYFAPALSSSSSTTTTTPNQSKNITGARCLLFLGDSVTTDHISPAGSIATSSDAGAFLAERGVGISDFNSYGSRRGNDMIMRRGTFANVRLSNKLLSSSSASSSSSTTTSNKNNNNKSTSSTTTGPRTLHFPSQDVMSVFSASERYKSENIPLIIIAGKEYGSGSSRDYAAKGPLLLGVKIVIAESYERIHRSNLVGMSIIPLQFLPGENASKLGLTGKEEFSIEFPSSSSEAIVSTDTGVKFKTLIRVDTVAESRYISVGGILPFVVQRLMERSKLGRGAVGSSKL